MLTPGNKKLGGHLIWGFGLPSGTVKLCPGMTPTCRRVCYAVRLQGFRPQAARLYRRNLKLSKRKDFVKRVRAFLVSQGIRVVRIHTGGEFHSAKYTHKWGRIAERLAHLADSFQQLKERVRDAVATEMGKVVADAIRDWITTALQARMTMRFRSGEAAFMPPRDADGWDDTEPWREEETFDQSTADPPEPKVSSWAAALSLGFVAAKWLIARRLSFMPSVGMGVLLGTFALVGGPLVQASLAAASAAADLVTITRAESRPPN